jgi:hypothetical protein
MATHQGDESLAHPKVKKFATPNGASKTVTPTDTSVGDGTMYPPGPLSSVKPSQLSKRPK